MFLSHWKDSILWAFTRVNTSLKLGLMVSFLSFYLTNWQVQAWVVFIFSKSVTVANWARWRRRRLAGLASTLCSSFVPNRTESDSNAIVGKSEARNFRPFGREDPGTHGRLETDLSERLLVKAPCQKFAQIARATRKDGNSSNLPFVTWTWKCAKLRTNLTRGRESARHCGLFSKSLTRRRDISMIFIIDGRPFRRSSSSFA